MPTTLHFQGKSSRLNRNATLEYIVMRLEDVEYSLLHTLLYKVMHGLQRAVVNMPAMHIKYQTVLVVPKLLQYDTSTSRCPFRAVSLPSQRLFRCFLIVYHFLGPDCHMYNIRRVRVKSTFCCKNKYAG